MPPTGMSVFQVFWELQVLEPWTMCVLDVLKMMQLFPSCVKEKLLYASLHACECANGDQGNKEKTDASRLLCMWILKHLCRYLYDL